jgi:hypothetical protein
MDKKHIIILMYWRDLTQAFGVWSLALQNYGALLIDQYDALFAGKYNIFARFLALTTSRGRETVGEIDSQHCKTPKFGRYRRNLKT